MFQNIKNGVVRMYEEYENDLWMTAEHDEIWIGHNSDFYPKKLIKQMKEWGWDFETGMGFHHYV